MQILNIYILVDYENYCAVVLNPLPRDHSTTHFVFLLWRTQFGSCSSLLMSWQFDSCALNMGDIHNMQFCDSPGPRLRSSTVWCYGSIMVAYSEERMTSRLSFQLILRAPWAPIGRSQASVDPMFEPLKLARPQVTSPARVMLFFSSSLAPHVL